MLRQKILTLMVGVGMLFYALGATANVPTVHVYNWSDYIDPQMIEQFEKQTGIRVVYDVFDSNEVLETKLMAGKSGYDVVFPSDAFLQRQIIAGVYQPLRNEWLPNRQFLWEKIEKKLDVYDPGNRHSLPYAWGTTGFGYDEIKVKKILGPNYPKNSLALIFDEKYLKPLSKCGVRVLDAPMEMIPAALVWLGYQPNSKKMNELKEAEKLLIKMSKYVQKFDSSHYIHALATGESCLVVGWSGGVLQAKERVKKAGANRNIVYFTFKEGSQMWFDMMAIPADAPNPKNAHAFINFILNPEISAQLTRYIKFPTANEKAASLLGPKYLNNRTIYPSFDDNLYVTTLVDQKKQRWITRAWSRIRVGRSGE